MNGPDIENSGVYRLVVNNDAYKKDLNVTLLVKCKDLTPSSINN